jgi:hypothetical protein
MPLTLKDKEEILSEQVPTPQPILHKPKEDSRLLKNIVRILFILIVSASLIFLVYIFTRKDRIKSSPNESYEPATPEVSKPDVNQPTESVQSVGSRFAQISTNLTGVGQYTLFISSYKIKEPAQDEVSRWNEAGYKASVVEANNHFRVSLGGYGTVPDAEQTAHELEEAFENGYWIGSLR